MEELSWKHAVICSRNLHFVSLQVLVLKNFMFSIPRGKHRKDLDRAGRIQSLQFKRLMTVEQSRNVILHGFRALGISDFTVADNWLVVSTNQQLDGLAIINRKGSLYLCEKVCCPNCPWTSSEMFF
jgi:hypothetical protein